MSLLLGAWLAASPSASFEDFWFRPPGQCDLRVIPSGLAARSTPENLDRVLLALAWLGNPLPGRPAPRREDLLPGSPRPYRQGRHQGLDLYSSRKGPDPDPVRAAGDGWVVRADHDYIEMSPEERGRVLGRQAPDGTGSPEDLDRLHGRQVWILHPGAVLTRYSHLSGIGEGIRRGAWIGKGEILGTMGNSGTSSGAEGGRDDIHLHFEIHFQSGPFWEGLTLEQVREVLDEMFGR